MSFLVVLIATCLVAVLAARSIHRHPGWWYGAVLALDAVYFYGVFFGFPPTVLQILTPLVQRGMLATALFVVVMYCGVFPENSWVRRTVGPVRAELSIMACLLACAHCVNYLSSYVGVLLTNLGVLDTNQLASLTIALVLLVLLAVLTITSVKAVKRRMASGTWKTVQRAAYVFFGLIFVHEVLILYPSALKGSGDAAATLAVSAVVFGGYYVLRLVRFALDRRAARAPEAAVVCDEEDSCVCVG